MDTELMSFGELSRLIGARRISFSSFSGFSSVAIDSRKVKKGGLFFALCGSVSDGHSFVEAAFNAGAHAAVVDVQKIKSFDLENTAKKMSKDLIVVHNTLKGLQDSARVYLEKFPGLLKIGITGSSGKTTTKEIAAAIISNEKNVVKNTGNLNSETGLPLSVFEVRTHHEAGVFELGMNRKDEIYEIADVLKPNIALITNIGTAHIEYFGSKAEILKEKKCIFKFLSDNDTALIPKDDELSSVLADGVNGKVRFYGGDSFGELQETRSLGLDGTEIIWAGEKINFALPGRHSLHDAMAAIAIAREVPVSNSAIKKGLESVKPLFGRLEILKGRTTVIRDCYNANPESTSQSIEFCDSVDWPSRKVYVIGDMLELGENSRFAHAQIGELLAKSKADKVFLFGAEIEEAVSGLASRNRAFFHTCDFDDLSAALSGFVQSGDLVLLKGSRGCALERLSEMLTGGKI
ncbi:MAG: UDP-N-acetylmuramoyl-tripeptide--D-alanyl-D-alanine ligase [Treponema sp.]|jgi:UDP-N-acetylmuramoyl-tripeptide--D-alanyl-D-alanine ligase|nr:UDP-N-acetylmuramoyl-tripeptide--D-alanyl-D-alanine ligase [Treponema sp.]